ncbi:glycosyltransferase family 4 protein [Shewanella mangrovi]|uniref:glycosyltransferase family 4 protein n=1 Tax=Shewanella mangrovi TaxID=1515746 RepID=UPI00068FC14F|nr:glycosyltransferase family 4 protein [Shewanella mangrovi]
MKDSITPFTSLYAAFDRFPLPKGASTHIQQMATTLFQYSGDGLLYVAGDDGVAPFAQEVLGDVVVTLLRSNTAGLPQNVLLRAMAYADQLRVLLHRYGHQLNIAHFRDPWAGVPLIDFKQSQRTSLKLVYEVNALPSIELPIHLSLSASTLARIKHWEQRCLDSADIIVTPSRLTKARLERLTNTPVYYLPNGATVASAQELSNHPQSNIPSLIYFGGAQRWQGLHTLLQALVIVRRQLPMKLVMCLSLDNRHAKQLKQQIRALQLDDCIELYFGLSQAQLRSKIIQATASIAPLAACERNMLQGCCPLKIIESMACGTAVIASDIPVVHELLRHNQHGLLVPPARPSVLARACIELLTQPDFAAQLGRAGKQHIAQYFQWHSINQQLQQLYQQLASPHSSLTRTQNECLLSEPV